MVQSGRAVIERANIGIIVIQDGKPAFYNPKIYEMLGFTEGEFHQREFATLFHPEDAQRGVQWLNGAPTEYDANSNLLQIRALNKANDIKWLDIHSTAIEWEGRPAIQAFITDITKHKQAEEALRTNETRLSDVMKMAHLGHWELDIEKGLFTFTDHFYAIFRTSVAEVGGYTMTIDEYAQRFIHPEDLYLVAEEVQRAIETTDPNYSRQIEHRMLYADGEVGYVAVRIFVVKDQQGRTIKTFGANQDITELKRAEEEKRKLETQVAHSQKLETIGTLAGGIAHDFNNILTSIIGYADIARTSISKTDPLYEDFVEILKGANRAKELIGQILTFGRQIEQERRPLHLHLIVKEALKLLRSSIPTTIEIREDIDITCEQVLADPSQIHQVIVNLCTNAYQAMRDGGVLSIEMKQIELDKATVEALPLLEPKDHILLTVSDNGAGMSEETIDRIFEPFFTTKSVNEGTGMGLSVVHGIVRGHGGDINVVSQVGQGSTFRIYLPIMRTESRNDDNQPDSFKGGSESIFVVDDETSVVNVLKKMLARLGYQVTVAGSGTTALEVFRKNPEDYDLVLTDLTMPGISGLDLAKRIKRINPRIRIILMTGYGKNLSGDIQNECGICDVMAKPIVITELAAAIRKILDKS